MKQHTSKFMKSVAAFYLAFPVLHVVLAAVLFNIPFKLCVGILLSPFYYLVAILAAIGGYGLWEMRRWTWYLFVAVNGLIAYENAYFVQSFGESHHGFLAFLFSLTIQALVVYRVAREVRVPYFFPRIRWWEVNPRYRLAVAVAISRAAPPAPAAMTEGEILDLSIGGCFIKLRTELAAEEPLSIKFSMFGKSLDLAGTVVWKTQSSVTHPRGVGVKFSGLTKDDKRALRMITRRLRKISSHYRRHRYLMNQDEFMRRLEELEAGIDTAPGKGPKGTVA